MTPITPALTRQQLCAALGVSEATIRRREADGMPVIPVGIRSKRYDLDECRRWLKENQPSCQSGQTKKAASMLGSWSAGAEFTELCRKVQLRATPS